MATKFETETCGRCGGGGSYSWNAMNGSTCFGCKGTGIRYTKRGGAAKDFLIASQRKPVSEVKPGMYVWDDMVGKRAAGLPILAIGQSTSAQVLPDGTLVPYVEITTRRGGFCVFATSTVRCVANQEEQDALMAAALEYQSTLGKNGKPMKKKSGTA